MDSTELEAEVPVCAESAEDEWRSSKKAKKFLSCLRDALRPHLCDGCVEKWLKTE